MSSLGFLDYLLIYNIFKIQVEIMKHVFVFGNKFRCFFKKDETIVKTCEKTSTILKN